MKRILLGMAALALSGCAGLAYASHGPIGNIGVYGDTMANEHVTDNALGTKTGQACSTSILGIVTTGDASVPTAAKNGGITKIGSVDNKFSQVLGLYATYCVIVTGS